jgi:putative ABC transport system ATP-binding protein
MTAISGDEPRGATVGLRDVVKRFVAGGSQITAVDHISVNFEAGAMTAVTGPSGSGKSTLLHLVGAIEPADSGSVTIDGVDITSLRRGRLSAYRRGVGFVFQRYHLLPALTALENVIAPTLAYRVDFNRAERGRELLAAVGLEGRERSLPSQLSGGQQQRVAIARALVGRPRVLLADEPTGNLDSSTGGEILDLLATIRAQRSMTVLVATHEQHVAAACDRVVRLRDGRIVHDADLRGGPDMAETLARIEGLRL